MFIFLLPFGHDLLALLDDPHHALASLRSWLDAEDAEALLEPLDLGFGFLQMRLEQLLQLLGMGRLHHLGKRLLNLLLAMQDVAQLIDEKLPKRRLVRPAP